MNLYLVQHAEAKTREEDADRSLSTTGWADIRKVAAYVAGHGDIRVRQINHSGKTRARQTAEALAEALQPIEGISDIPDLAPKDDPVVWVRYLAETTRDLMLVGHLPHLSRLAGLLLCQDAAKTIIDFQKGGVVCLNRNDAGEWALRWMVIPEIV
ncbi:MAG: phosphohistidine phosphatase SixA [Chloroflexota bacterium]